MMAERGLARHPITVGLYTSLPTLVRKVVPVSGPGASDQQLPSRISVLHGQTVECGNHCHEPVSIHPGLMQVDGRPPTGIPLFDWVMLALPFNPPALVVQLTS
jgi:hypothetical protein